MTIKSSVKKTLKLFHSHRKEGKDIVIVTLPRAGSTLLAEILNVDKSCKVCSEPLGLNPQNIRVLNKYFQAANLKERYTDIPQTMISSLKRYFSDLSEGKTWNSFYWSDLFSKNHQFKTKRTIFKTHKLTYLYEDLFNKIDANIVCLVRHPISHSLSRIRNNWSEYSVQFSRSQKIRNQLNKKQIKLIDMIIASGTELEKFVLSWCLENYLIIKSFQNNKYTNHVLLTYEELIYYPEQVIKQLCSGLDLLYYEEMARMIKKPSHGIVHSTEETKRNIMQGETKKMMSGWREKISLDEEKKLFKILDELDIDLYKTGDDLPAKKYRLVK